MEEQQRIQPLLPEKNGKHPQPLLPVYAPTFQENKAEEWDLRQFLTVLRRRVVVVGGVGIAICGAVWFSTLTREARYEAKFGLLVEPVTAENRLAGLTQIPGASSNQEQGLDYDTQIQVLRSPELMAPIIKQLSTRYPDISYGSLLGNLTISRFEETKILEVSYQDSDPQKVQFVLQGLAREYLKYSLQQRQTNLRQGIQFVNNQLPQLQMRVNTWQKQLQQFRQQYNFVDPQVEAEQLATQISTVNIQQLNVQNQLAEAGAFYKTLQGKSGKQLVEARASYRTLQNRSSSGEDALVEKEAPLYEGIVANVRELDSQIATESAKLHTDNPTLQILREKRENLLPVLQNEAERVLGNKLVQVSNEISLLKLSDAKIAKAESSLNGQVKRLSVLTRQYNDLQRELKIATDSLNRFLEKRESLQIENAQQELPWQILAAPKLPTAPISANVKRNLILGVIAGLLAGIGAALLTERLDNVFHSPEDLNEVTKLPLLGVIPFHKYIQPRTRASEATVETRPSGSNLVFRNVNKAQGESYFPFVEAFRSLYTNIGFLSSDTPIQSLVITSSVHADGKSTVSLNLAQAAAAMGQRVLLVDADLRRPQVHNLLGIRNDQGLSNVISTNLPVLDAIQQSPLWDNLFVLTSGQIPPDATKLLSSKKMQNIMEQLRQEFDLVIYDTPPLLGLADSSLLAPYTSGIVLVVRMGKTDRSILTQALERLKISRAPILGTVVNGFKNYNKLAYGYYYYRPRAQNA